MRAHLSQRRLRNKIQLAQEELIKDKGEVSLDSFPEPHRRRWRRLQTALRFVVRLRLVLKHARLFGARPDLRRYHETVKPRDASMLRHLLESRSLARLHAALLLFFGLLAAVFVPLGTAYELGQTSQSVFAAFMYTLYGYFWLDLFLASAKEIKTGYLSASRGDPPADPGPDQPYLWSSYFWLDLLASIPFDLFTDAGLLRFNSLMKVPSLSRAIARSFTTQGAGGRRSKPSLGPVGSRNTRLLEWLKPGLFVAVFLHSAVCSWVRFSRAAEDNWLLK